MPATLQILEVFDRIWHDDSIVYKVKAFQEDPLSKGTAYTTVLKWSKPLERARLSKAASKEYRQRLMRIDKPATNRRSGKYPDMEKEVYRLFKEKRSRGRKVSARWVSSTARQVMKVMHPDVRFSATVSWRVRFRRRFNLHPARRKTNVKNKTFADSEPVLLRYFRGLRRRLQFDASEVEPEESQLVEPEPDDFNPEREEEDCVGGAADQQLDSSDDEDDEDKLLTFESALISGMRVASAAPPQMQLEFKSVAAKELKDKVILYNWIGLGWCAGRIRRPSFDKNKLVKVDGERCPENFIIAYDDGEGPHCLTVGKNGKEGASA